MEVIATAAAICLPFAALAFGAGTILGGYLKEKATTIGLIIIGIVIVFVAGANF